MVSAVAKQAGIEHAENYVDMSMIRDEEMDRVVQEYTVFGRVSPQQKKLLVTAMQKQGHRVAMTGDGVNDLLAMKQADCSIAVGQGSDAAKQTAQLVLIDSDFSVLRSVLAEGRRVVNNITKSAGVFFIKTIYSVLLCLVCIILNMDFPFLPIQITLIDLVIEGYPAFFISFEPNDKRITGRFLPTALRLAAPNAIVITLSCIAVFLLNWLGAMPLGRPAADPVDVSGSGHHRHCCGVEVLLAVKQAPRLFGHYHYHWLLCGGAVFPQSASVGPAGEHHHLGSVDFRSGWNFAGTAAGFADSQEVYQTLAFGGVIV